LDEPPPRPDSTAANAPVAEALGEIETPPSPAAFPEARADADVPLRHEDLTITRRGQRPSAAELLAKGYTFATGPDGRMVIFDAKGQVADAALALPGVENSTPDTRVTEAVSEVVPPAASEALTAAVDEVVATVASDDIAVGEVTPKVVDEVVTPPASEAAAEVVAEVVTPPASEAAAEVVAEAVTPPASEAVVDMVAEAVTPAASEAAADVVAEFLEPTPVVEPEPEPEIAPQRKARKKTAREPAVKTLDEITPPPRADRKTGGEPGKMYVIAVSSQKGGSGKTTIAAHLAVRADAAGQGPVVLIDTDPQGSLAEWWQARSNDSPALATVRPEELGANLAELRSYGTAIAIIDTPPALTGSIEQVIAMADLILIPVRPSPHDLRAAGGTVELARKAGKPFMFIVNSASPRASITAQAVAALSEHGRVAPVILYQRTEYAASMIDGRTVTETAGSGRSAQEIVELWQCVYAQIGMRVAA
ncbi:MAG: AAA family ATPase, partial [Stellaceae bacterium]